MVGESTFQRPALGIDGHDRSLETALHQIAGDKHFVVAAIANERDGVGVKERIQISSGHGEPGCCSRWV